MNATTSDRGRAPRARLIVAAVLAVLLLLAFITPLPYVIEYPGPAVNTIGEVEGKPVISIEGHPSYPTSGQLDLTTVSIAGAPGHSVYAGDVLRGWFDPHARVIPREAIFPEGLSASTNEAFNVANMNSSQQEAIAQAVTALGKEVTPLVLIGAVRQGGPADGVLEPGDEVVQVAGKPAGSLQEVREATASTPAGQKVQMQVRRAGKLIDLQVPTETSGGKSRVGVVLVRGYRFPFEVKISLDNIGGPSAGMMFALGVYDKLTPGELTGGKNIAGTGTIDTGDGKVGRIGGIAQKMIGARNSGARFFLAPADNCKEVRGNVPDGLEVVRVGTFQEALHAVETIGKTGNIKGLPTCSASR
ncbi:YlbL family protein [Dermabacteraceae bacterium P13088]